MQVIGRPKLGALLAGVVAGVVFSAQAAEAQIKALPAEQSVEMQQVVKPLAIRATPPQAPATFLANKQAAARRRAHFRTPEPLAAPQSEKVAPDELPPEVQVQPRPAAAARPVVDPLVRLGPKATNGIVGAVCEPSLAVSQHGHILYTANWFSAFSRNGAENLQYVNPAEAFPEDPFEFCCDQVALYSPKHDMMIWFLQYAVGTSQGNISNIFRVAVASGQEEISSQSWRFFDFSPVSLGNWKGEWFDFPDLAVSDNFLYITSNSFDSRGTVATANDRFARAVVVRLPLKAMTEKRNLKREEISVFSTTTGFSLRPTQGARDGVMHFAGHDEARIGSHIEVYTWPENSADVQRDAFKVDNWNVSGYNSICKDGSTWLDRTDRRITAAWAAGGQLGFAWTAGRVPNHNQLRHPHVRVAVLSLDGNKKPSKVVAQPHLWNEKFAFAYPAASATAAGTVGLAVCFGGGGPTSGHNPGLAVGFLETQGGQQLWNLATVVEGPSGPSDGMWGDYLAVRPDGQGQGFVASGFVAQAATPRDQVTPLFVRFRAEGAPPPPPPPPPPVGPGTDKILKAIQEKVEKLKKETDELLEFIKKNQSPGGPGGPGGTGSTGGNAGGVSLLASLEERITRWLSDPRFMGITGLDFATSIEARIERWKADPRYRGQ